MATTSTVEDDVYDLSLKKFRWKTKGHFDELADLFDYELVFVHLTGSVTSKQEWMRQLRTHSFVHERAPTMAEAMSSSSGNRGDRQLGERQSGVVGLWPQLLDAGEDVRAQKVPYTGPGPRPSSVASPLGPLGPAGTRNAPCRFARAPDPSVHVGLDSGPSRRGLLHPLDSSRVSGAAAPASGSEKRRSVRRRVVEAPSLDHETGLFTGTEARLLRRITGGMSCMIAVM